MDEEPKFYLFCWMGRLTKGVITSGPEPENFQASDQRRALISKLVALFAERPQRSENVDTDSHAMGISSWHIVDSLLKASKDEETICSSYKSIFGEPFSFGSILQTFLSDCTAYSEPTGVATIEALIVRTKIVLDVLVHLGCLLQKDGGQHQEDSPLVKDFDQILCFGVSCLQKLCGNNAENEPHYQVLQSVLHIFSSVSLISQHPLMEYDRWSLDQEYLRGTNDDSGFLLMYASKLARKAAQFLPDSISGESEWGMVASAMKPAISLFQLQLSYMRRPCGAVESSEDFLPELRRVVENLSGAASDDYIVEASKWCAVSVLSRLCDSLALEGERLYAVEVAAWNNSVVTIDSQSDIHRWFEAAAVALQASDSVVSRDSPPNRHTSVDSVDSSSLEAFACLLRQRLARPRTQAELIEIDGQLRSHLLQIEQSDVSSGLTIDQPGLLLWSKSTAQLALAELEESRGRIERGLYHTKECFQSCRKLSKQIERRKFSESKRNGSSAPFWQEIVMATLLIRCTQRQVECLGKMASFYMRTGAWRKANRYTVTATKLAGFEALGDGDETQGFSQLVSASRSHPYNNSQEMRLRRLHLRASARATPWDVVNKELDGEYRLCSMPQTRFSKLAVGNNRRLDEVLNVFEGEYFYLTASENRRFIIASILLQFIVPHAFFNSHQDVKRWTRFPAHRSCGRLTRSTRLQIFSIHRRFFGIGRTKSERCFRPTSLFQPKVGYGPAVSVVSGCCIC